MPSTISLGLLSLAASALAVPFPSGSWPSYPSGTGAPYPLYNGTAQLPPSGQPRHQRQSTAPAAGDSTSTTTNTLTDYQTIVTTIYATGGSGSALVNAAATDSACTTTPTVTQTVTNKVYVTVTPGQASSAVAAPVVSSSYSSSSSAAPVASSVNVAQAASSKPAYSTATSAAVSSAAASSAAPSSSAVASSSVAPSSSAAGTSSAASSSSTASSDSGTKRGIAYDDASFIAAFSGTQTSWCYNWGQTAGGDTDGNTYIPTLWNASSDQGTIGYERTQTWVANAKSAISNGATALFSFNEPDLPAQANMEPADAATQYKTWLSDEFSSAGVTLVAPAVTNGGGDMGLTWMKNFLSACSDCQVDAVNVHWYDAATNTDGFKEHVSSANSESGKPVYVTEFAPTGSDDEITSFLEEVLPWLDSQDYVVKYSYFMAADGAQYLNSGTGLSAIGETYAKYTG